MKRYAAVLSACLLFSALLPGFALANPSKSGSGRDPASCQESGRYQLFQGSYTTFDLKRKETYVHQAVFLLDSQTGEVKRYINKIDENGQYIETWLPTDLPAAAKR